jgi:ATP-dependent DNA ligase
MQMKLPFQPPVSHMLAKAVPEIPSSDDWVYEPKWDGFRCMMFFDGAQVYLQSRDAKPLARYFPELESALRSAVPGRMVLDGEIVIATDSGLAFDALQMRIHPAESRVRMLAAEMPASFVAFDILALDDDDLRENGFAERRSVLTKALAGVQSPVHVTPATLDRTIAADWFERFEGAGLDGIIAKRSGEAYLPGKRAWLKIKHVRTVDCVLGGLRWSRGEEGRSIGSLLLGLYDEHGVLHHVGHTSSFKVAERIAMVEALMPLMSTDESEGFGGGRTPGSPSRWSQRDMDWVRLRPDLVCEVSFDHMQGDRFRHAATFRRWRPDKSPEECTYDQIITTPPVELAQVFGGK